MAGTIKFDDYKDALQELANLTKSEVHVSGGPAVKPAPVAPPRQVPTKPGQPGQKPVREPRTIPMPGPKNRGMVEEQAKAASSRELVFASEEEALQFLANETGQKVMIAKFTSPTWKGESRMTQKGLSVPRHTEFKEEDKWLRDADKKEVLEKAERDPMVAVKYAINVLKGRFPEAEKLIKKSHPVALVYADKVLRDLERDAKEWQAWQDEFGGTVGA